MAYSVVPDLVEAIVSAAQDALPDVTVTDTRPVTLDPGDYLAVCFNDFAPAVTTQRDFATTGRDGSIDEVGEIWCTAAAMVGDDDPATARRRVYDIAAAVDQLCRIRGGTDPAFGVERALWTRMGDQGQYDPIPGTTGSAGILTFSIHYEARP